MLPFFLAIFSTLALRHYFPSIFYGKLYNKKLRMHCHKCGGEFQGYEYEKNKLDENTWNQTKSGWNPKMGGKPYVVCKIDPWENYSVSTLKYCEVKPYTKKKADFRNKLTGILILFFILLIHFIYLNVN